MSLFTICSINICVYTVNRTPALNIDGRYSSMLRMELNIKWKDNISNAVLVQDLETEPQRVRPRRLRLAGYIARHDDLIANKTISVGLPPMDGDDRADLSTHLLTRH